MRTEPEFLEKLFPKVDTVTLKKTTIIEFCETNNKKPSQRSKDPIERKLHQSMESYCSPAANSYDSVFAEKINKMFPIIDTASLKKTSIIEFCESNKRKPSSVSKCPIEKKLYQVMNNYCFPSQSSYDPAFKKQLDKLCKKLGISK
jgi:hypothetical protein